jgi:hypothetical protein
MTTERDIWPGWYKRFCVRLAVLVLCPCAVAWHSWRGHKVDADVWREVGWHCWKTGTTGLGR